MSRLSFEEEQLLSQTISLENPTKYATLERLQNMIPDTEEAARLLSELWSRILDMSERQFLIACVYAMDNKVEAGDLHE